MKLNNGTPQVITVKMGIYLCCCYRFMSEHLLDSPQVCASLNEMSGKGMPESMRTDRLFYSGLLCQILYYRKYHHSGEFPATPV